MVAGQPIGTQNQSEAHPQTWIRDKLKLIFKLQTRTPIKLKLDLGACQGKIHCCRTRDHNSNWVSQTQIRFPATRIELPKLRSGLKPKFKLQLTHKLKIEMKQTQVHKVGAVRFEFVHWVGNHSRSYRQEGHANGKEMHRKRKRNKPGSNEDSTKRKLQRKRYHEVKRPKTNWSGNKMNWMNCVSSYSNRGHQSQICI